MKSFNDIDHPEAIRRAMAEFDRLGRDTFLREYGFGKARSFFLQGEKNLYDPKAIVGGALW